jgi:hypothetical protein
MVSTFSKLSTWVSGAVIATTFLAAATPAHSAAITGDLNFNGNLRASLTGFDFQPLGGVNGDFTVQNFGNTGFFTSLTGTGGKIADLNVGISPVNTALNLTNTLTFNAASNVSFTLTRLLGGTFSIPGCSLSPAAAGQTCTPFVGSPVNFVNTSASSSTGSFSVEGFFTDSSTGEKFLGSGQFTANFLGQNYQQILAILGSPGPTNFVDTPFTGVFRAVPEPDMLPSVLGLGMVIAGAVTLRRRVVAAK